MILTTTSPTTAELHRFVNRRFNGIFKRGLKNNFKTQITNSVLGLENNFETQITNLINHKFMNYDFNIIFKNIFM